MIKEKEIIRVSGTDANGGLPSVSVTSDAILFTDSPWSLSVWFTGLVITGQDPSIQIEGSNDPENDPSSVDTNSFVPLTNGFATLGDNKGFKSKYFKYKWFRLVYTANGATAVGAKYFDLIQDR